MKKYSGAWLLSATTMAMLFWLAACSSPNDAGIDVLPGDENIHGTYADTFGIEMRTLLFDSTQSYKLSADLFGNYIDEQFGHIYAESYVQPRLVASNLVFGADPNLLLLDSLTLTLDLSGFYGRYDDPLPLEIYEITEQFATDSSLYSRSHLAADTTIDLADGYHVNFSGLAGYYDRITIRLNDSLGRKLLFANTSQLVSNATFTDFFKGLLIRSSTVNQSVSREPGGVFLFDPRSEKSFMTLHYKYNGTKDSTNFAINATSERFHRIVRTDWQGRLLQQAVADSGNTKPVYACLQAGALVNLYVAIPSMMSLDPAIINRATLVLHVDPAYLGSINRFEPPSEVFLLTAKADKKHPSNINVINSSVSYNVSTHEYRIPMTNTLQQILSGKLANNGFIIVPGENGISLNRAVIGGPGHPTLAPRLEVVYTSVPKH
jgi:hypothetical protein